MMPYPWRLFNNSMRNALQNSLKRLRRQKVELYQIHMPLPPKRPEKWMDDMADLHNDGLIDAIGVSNYNLQQTIAAQETLKNADCVSLQTRWNTIAGSAYRDQRFDGLL